MNPTTRPNAPNRSNFLTATVIVWTLQNLSEIMSNRPKRPSNDTLILWGWIFFIISSLFFVAVGIRAGDWLTTAGALFFLSANILFLIPVLREKKEK
ncbi:MAG: hypothetical protein ACPG8W_09485 [Candidatus Promineifilaceae bacterium]